MANQSDTTTKTTVMDISVFDCPICFELLEDPRILTGCQHSICNQCVQNLSTYGMIRCPTCRSFTKLPASGQLPKNLSVQNIVDEFKTKCNDSAMERLGQEGDADVLVECQTPECKKIAKACAESILTIDDFWQCQDDKCNKILCSTCVRKCHSDHVTVSYRDVVFSLAKQTHAEALSRLRLCTAKRELCAEFLANGSRLHKNLGLYLSTFQETCTKRVELQEHTEVCFAVAESVLFRSADDVLTVSPVKLMDEANSALVEEIEVLDYLMAFRVGFTEYLAKGVDKLLYFMDESRRMTETRKEAVYKPVRIPPHFHSYHDFDKHARSMKVKARGIVFKLANRQHVELPDDLKLNPTQLMAEMHDIFRAVLREVQSVTEEYLPTKCGQLKIVTSFLCGITECRNFNAEYAVVTEFYQEDCMETLLTAIRSEMTFICLEKITKKTMVQCSCMFFVPLSFHCTAVTDFAHTVGHVMRK